MAELIHYLHQQKEDNLSIVNHYGYEQAEKVCRFHSSFPEYTVTPLVRLENLAKLFGVKDIYVKDESYRFGLNAFKVLGGSYAIACELAKRLQLPVEELTYDKLMAPEVKQKLGELTFVTATDGNHGRGVAWTASRLQQKAIVLMPKGTELARLEAIKAFGAEAYITDVNYDDTVRMARKIAAECGGIMVQDTSWEGYEDVPLHIMQGYTTMGYEMVRQLQGVRPTHVFLQAGVGAMAGAVAAFFADYYKADKPIITIVEPEKADCIFKTAKADDGKLHNVTGALDSIMAGLCCGEPCGLAWDMLRRYADNFASMPDEFAAYGMRVLGNPLSGDTALFQVKAAQQALVLPCWAVVTHRPTLFCSLMKALLCCVFLPKVIQRRQNTEALSGPENIAWISFRVSKNSLAMRLTSVFKNNANKFMKSC